MRRAEEKELLQETTQMACRPFPPLLGPLLLLLAPPRGLGGLISLLSLPTFLGHSFPLDSGSLRDPLLSVLGPPSEHTPGGERGEEARRCHPTRMDESHPRNMSQLDPAPQSCSGLVLRGRGRAGDWQKLRPESSHPCN